MRFKEFLESTLERLPMELFFSHIVALPKEEVEEACDWFDGPLDVSGASTDFYDHIIDWLEDNLEPGEKSIYTSPRFAGSTENIVRARLRQRMKKMGALDENQELDTLPAEMWLRHHLKIDQEQAEDALAWLRQKDNWLSTEVWDKMMKLAMKHTEFPKNFVSGTQQDDIVRFALAKAAKTDDIKLLESSDPLVRTGIEMWLRQKLKLTQAEAESVYDWMVDLLSDVDDLNTNVYKKMRTFAKGIADPSVPFDDSEMHAAIHRAIEADGFHMEFKG